jgi:hypothetical protein
MITIIVAFLTTLATQAVIYYIAHKVNPTATQAVINSAKTDVETAVTTEVTAAKADVASKL